MEEFGSCDVVGKLKFHRKFAMAFLNFACVARDAQGTVGSH